MEKLLLLIGYLCVAGSIKSLGFVPTSISYFDIWILALNFLIAIYMLRAAFKSARWLPEKFFVIGWLIQKNRKLKFQIASLQSEVEELNSEISTLVECWVPRQSQSQSSTSSKRADLSPKEPKAPQKSHNFGLSMDFAESSLQGKLNEDSQKSEYSQRPEPSDKQNQLSI